MMDSNERMSRNDRQSGDGFSRSPARHNFDRICLNNLDLSSLGAAAALPADERKLDNSAERLRDQSRQLDEAATAEALLTRMHRLINTYPRSSDQLARGRGLMSNRNGSLTSLDRSPGAPRVNNLASLQNQSGADVPERIGRNSALANNLRDRNGSGSNSGALASNFGGGGDFSTHQMRNDLRSANASSISMSTTDPFATAMGDSLHTAAQDSRMSGMNRIVSQLMQIRESIQQANASINNISEQENSPETTRHLNRMQELIQKLRQQEEGYIQLLSQMVDEDRISRDGSMTHAADHESILRISEQNGNGMANLQDDNDSIDVPMGVDPPSDGDNTAESSSGAAEVTNSDTAYVEDAYAELEQLRCQRDMLREILSQHEELRALQGRQVALLRMQRETQQQLLDARENADATSDDAIDEEDIQQLPVRLRVGTNSSHVADNDYSSLRRLLQQQQQQQQHDSARGTRSSENLSSDNLPNSRHDLDDDDEEEEEDEREDEDEEDEEKNDDEKNEDEDGSRNIRRSRPDSLDEAMLNSAVPRELLELRRRLNMLTDMHDDLQGTESLNQMPSNSRQSKSTSEDLMDDSEFQRLTKSKAELSERLRDLQSKKDNLDTLLRQLQTFRDLRSTEETGADEMVDAAGDRMLSENELAQLLRLETDSASSSVRQFAESQEMGKLAENTAEDAEEALRLLETQRKLAKLKEVRERLDRIRSMMTYYQDATAFIHSGDGEESLESPQGAVANPSASGTSNRGAKGSRQRILNYGSTSETSSQTSEHVGRHPRNPQGQKIALAAGAVGGPRDSDLEDLSLDSEKCWTEHPSLVGRIRQLKSAKTRLNQLQSLIKAVEEGASLSDLPPELASVAAELINEDLDEETQLTRREMDDRPALRDVRIDSDVDLNFDDDSPEALLSSYKSAVEDQKRELSQLMGERDKLLALQRQMEQLHASLPSSSVWTRSQETAASSPGGLSQTMLMCAGGDSGSVDMKRAERSRKTPVTAQAARVAQQKEAEAMALRSLRMRPPSSSSAAAASMEALTAALQRAAVDSSTGSAGQARGDSSVTTETSEVAEMVSNTSSTQHGPSGTTNGSGGRRPDTVTFQEPVATFVANDEVYENICAQRIMREELLEKKREIAAIMKKDTSSGGYKRNQGGSTAGTDNQSMDTALGTLYSQDMTTAATWGEGSVLSNPEGDGDDGETATGGIDEDPAAAATVSEPSYSRNLNSITQNSGTLSNVGTLQTQINSTLELCRSMLIEQRKCSSLLQSYVLGSPIPVSSPTDLFAAQASLTTPMVVPPNWQQLNSPMVYSSLNFCCHRLVQLQADILNLQQQINSIASPDANKASLPNAPSSEDVTIPRRSREAALSTPNDVPPLDLSTVKIRGWHSGPRAPTAVSKECPPPHPKNISLGNRRVAGEQYRPGVSSGISGTGYTENLGAELDDMMSLLSAATEDLDPNRGLNLDSTLVSAMEPTYRSLYESQRCQAQTTQSNASRKQLKQHDLSVQRNDRASMARKIAPKTRTQGKAATHKPTMNSNIPRSKMEFGATDPEVDVGLFEALRETIYSEVASLISQNESRPNYLIDLFRELQLLSNDYLRQRVLYAIQDLVNKSMVRQSSSNVFAPPESWMRPRQESVNDEQTPSESLITTDEDGIQHDDMKLYDSALKKLETKASRLFQRGTERLNSAKQSVQRGLGNTDIESLHQQIIADYAEEVESVSSLSTPQASPFAADSLGDTVIHLDKTMQLLRELEERRHRNGSDQATSNSQQRIQENESLRPDHSQSMSGDREDQSETSSVSDCGIRTTVDPQQLNEEIRGVIQFLVPMLKQVSPQVCTGSLLTWIRELIMRRIRIVISRLHGSIEAAAVVAAAEKGEAATSSKNMSSPNQHLGEFDKFFDKQLAGMLQDSLKHYEGKLLAECIEDLMVDVSELLFNELAFFKLIADLEQSSGAIDAEPEDMATEEHENSGKSQQLDAIAAVVTMVMQGDDEELDNKRDDMMANEAPISSSSSEDGRSSGEKKKQTPVREADSSEAGDNSETEEPYENEESSDNEEMHDNGNISSSVHAVLAPSETKPMTRIGSDEDDDEEEEAEAENHLRADCADTAVSYVDADEKDILYDGSTEKSPQTIAENAVAKSSQKTEETAEQPLKNGDDKDLDLEDLPHRFDLDLTPSDIIEALPTGAAELAGTDDACPPPSGPGCDQRALGQ